MEISPRTYLTYLGGLVVLTIGFAVRAFLNRRKPGAFALGFLMLSMSSWAGFYLLEVAHPDLSVKILARKLLYLGMAFSPPLWLGFALRYTGLSAWWLKRKRMFALAAPGAVAFLLGTTNEYHRLIWTTMRAPGDQPGALVLEYGPALWVFTVIAYAMIAAGFAIYLLVFLRSEKSFRVKTGVILTGGLITTLTHVLFQFGEHPPPLDPTPLSFALSAPLIAFGYFRYGVSSLFPLASVFVMDSLRDAVIIVNANDQITDINREAKKLLGVKTVPEDTPVFDLLPQAALFREIWDAPHPDLKLELSTGGNTRWYEIQVTPLRSDGQNLLGRVIVFHEITVERSLLKAEQRRSAQLTLLEETGRQVADSFYEKEILQRAVDAIINRFGYAIAAVSIVTEDNMLEAAVISGTADFGYRPGYRQEMGRGIIGHTAETQKTYVTDSVTNDPYYFSSGQHFGSAICTPIWKRETLFGVLYVESLDSNAFDDLDIKTLETLASQISFSLQRAALHTEAQKNLRVLSTIQNISKSIASSLDMETITAQVVTSLREAFNYTHISIYLLEEDYLRLAFEVGYPDEMKISKIHISQGVSGRTIRTRAVQFIEDTTKDEVFLKADHHITSEICVPLLKEDRVLGTLNVESDNTRKLTQADVNLLVTLAGPIAISLDNARLHAQIKKLATTDAVTGLSNRHVFEQTLLAEVERAQRQGTNVSLIIFDIDSFKEFNDTYGHPAGDARLKAVANVTQKNLRKYDTAARYGGDEFAIILPDTDLQNALAFAQRLDKATKAGAPPTPTAEAGMPGYTLSMGIATFPQDARTHTELLLAADHAALKAKHLGKNRIQLASDNGPA